MKTVLIALSVHSVICVISKVISVNQFYSSLCIVFSSFFFSHLAIFDWMPDIVNFILLDARSFCVSINILELSSGRQLSSWKQFDPFSFVLQE